MVRRPADRRVLGPPALRIAGACGKDRLVLRAARDPESGPLAGHVPFGDLLDFPVSQPTHRADRDRTSPSRGAGDGATASGDRRSDHPPHSSTTRRPPVPALPPSAPFGWRGGRMAAPQRPGGRTTSPTLLARPPLDPAVSSTSPPPLHPAREGGDASSGRRRSPHRAAAQIRSRALLGPHEPLSITSRSRRTLRRVA